MDREVGRGGGRMEELRGRVREDREGEMEEEG